MKRHALKIEQSSTEKVRRKSRSIGALYLWPGAVMVMSNLGHIGLYEH
jgi:hypothetical protein